MSSFPVVLHPGKYSDPDHSTSTRHRWKVALYCLACVLVLALCFLTWKAAISPYLRVPSDGKEQLAGGQRDRSCA